jgi:hypothetical protein
MAPAAGFIDAILEADRKSPRKQRHTAKRIWERIRAEVPGCTAAERTVRQYVEHRKEALGLARRETFVPQSYDWGVEAQVDWYEAFADLDGERVKLQVFSLRSMASGAAYHRAYLRATQQAFLEAHELAPEKLTWPPAWPSRHAARGSACVSRPPPHWSTNSSRHNANRASAGCWHAGRAWN